jgi:hypothetical protein
VTSKPIGIERSGATCAKVLKDLGCHPLESFRWRTREQLVPSPFRLDFCEKPSADCFLFIIRKLLSFLDCLREKSAHWRDFTVTAPGKGRDEKETGGQLQAGSGPDEGYAAERWR